MIFFIEQQNELTGRLKNFFAEEVDLINGVWDSANIRMSEKYNMPAVHLWGEGYCKGDATDEELLALVDRVKVDYHDCYYHDECDENLFECLNREFLSIYRAKIEEVVKG